MITKWSELTLVNTIKMMTHVNHDEGVIASSRSCVKKNSTFQATGVAFEVQPVSGGSVPPSRHTPPRLNSRQAAAHVPISDH